MKEFLNEFLEELQKKSCKNSKRIKKKTLEELGSDSQRSSGGVPVASYLKNSGEIPGEAMEDFRKKIQVEVLRNYREIAERTSDEISGETIADI